MCACVVAVREQVCVHIHVCWSRWLLWTRPWGPWRGPPLVRLLTLNRASGRFPFSLLSKPLPQAGPLAISPSAGRLHSFVRSGAETPPGVQLPILKA